MKIKPLSSALRCFNDLNSYLGQSAEKGTRAASAEPAIGNYQTPSFYENIWLFVRLLARSGSLNLSFIPLNGENLSDKEARERNKPWALKTSPMACYGM